jgi:uncharacterized protein
MSSYTLRLQRINKPPAAVFPAQISPVQGWRACMSPPDVFQWHRIGPPTPPPPKSRRFSPMDVQVSRPAPIREPAGARLAARAEALVAWSWCHAPRLLLAAALLTVLFAVFAANRLSIDTDTSRLLDPSLPWRQQEIAYNEAFPQGKHTLLAVVEAPSAARAARASVLLAGALERRKDVFTSVSYPQGSAFFIRNALLLQDLARVKKTGAQLARSAQLLGPFAADPSLRGLFDALGQALGAVKAGLIAPEDLDRPLGAVAETMAARNAGRQAQMTWADFFSGEPPEPRELIGVIALKPRLDHKSLSPGRAAREAVLQTAASLHLTPAEGVRLSFGGDVALQDDELGSVKQGMGLATLLSSLLVLVILFAAIRAPKPVLAILITLVAGLIATLAFATASVHELNLISVAFVVMFIGIAVDFGIQFCIRFADELTRAPNPQEAVRRAGAGIGGALSLAALTTAIGFLAFAPTHYRGVSELGLIAGAGMLIALLLNLTLLPALLRYLGPKPATLPPRLFRTAAADRFIRRNRRAILAVFGLIGLASAMLLPHLSFDFDPLNLKDPQSQSVRTLNKLTAAGLASPYAMEALVSDRAAIGPLIARLKALSEVGRVTSIESFVPKDQDEKLAILTDAKSRLAPLMQARLAPPPSPGDIRDSARDLARRLALLAPAPGMPASYAVLAARLAELPKAGDSALLQLDQPLTAALKQRLAALPLLLNAGPVRFDGLPDDLKRQWIAPDGHYRIEIRPRFDPGSGGPKDNAELRRFVAAVQAVAPGALGGAYTIQKSGDAVWTAFQEAFFYALIGVAAVLALILRRAADVALVVGPLLVSALFTLALTVIIGLPINFANVIALPLLMGIGVAFNIYFVSNWRKGERAPLRSSTARAVLFSAMTTLSAVMSLSLSPHRGTASMGQLLTLCLAVTLICALLLLPALLALNRRAE